MAAPLIYFFFPRIGGVYYDALRDVGHNCLVGSHAATSIDGLHSNAVGAVGSHVMVCDVIAEHNSSGSAAGQHGLSASLSGRPSPSNVSGTHGIGGAVIGGRSSITMSSGIRRSIAVVGHDGASTAVSRHVSSTPVSGGPETCD